VIPIAAADVHPTCRLIVTVTPCGEPSQYAIRSVCPNGHRPVESFCRDHMVVYALGLSPARPLIACNTCLVDNGLRDVRMTLDHVVNLNTAEVLEPASPTYQRLCAQMGVPA
jgi:hypothetical protein